MKIHFIPLVLGFKNNIFLVISDRHLSGGFFIMLKKFSYWDIILMCQKGVRYVNTYICNIKINKCAELFLVVDSINIVIGFRFYTHFIITTIESKDPRACGSFFMHQYLIYIRNRRPNLMLSKTYCPSSSAGA